MKLENPHIICVFSTWLCSIELPFWSKVFSEDFIYVSETVTFDVIQTLFSTCRWSSPTCQQRGPASFLARTCLHNLGDSDIFKWKYIKSWKWKVLKIPSFLLNYKWKMIWFSPERFNHRQPHGLHPVMCCHSCGHVLLHRSHRLPPSSSAEAIGNVWQYLMHFFWSINYYYKILNLPKMNQWFKVQMWPPGGCLCSEIRDAWTPT